MKYLQEAFNLAVQDAQQPEEWFVALVEEHQYYGGPEEGGWWGTDTQVVAYRKYQTYEQAEMAKNAVLKLAKELETVALQQHGQYCQNTMDWLDERGLDADYLPQPDGPTKYHVIVDNKLPNSSYGPRHYE